MLMNLTRARIIQIWLAIVACAAVATFTLGAAMTASTGALLFAIALAPAALLYFLWPTVEPPTASEVMHGTRSL